MQTFGGMMECDIILCGILADVQTLIITPFLPKGLITNLG